MSIFWSMTFLVQTVTSVLGALGFAIMFKVRPRYLIYAAIGGGLTYAVYYAVNEWMLSVFAAALISSAFSALYSEILARVKRAPALVFLVPCSIPVVPGGSLYRMMLHLISQDFSKAWFYLTETLKVGIGIAGGIVAVSLIFSLTVGARSYWLTWRAELNRTK